MAPISSAAGGWTFLSVAGAFCRRLGWDGTGEEAADQLAERMSGHSTRAGYATAAAAANVPGYRIQQHTRHKSAEMVARYVRDADKWMKSGLKGVGF